MVISDLGGILYPYDVPAEGTLYVISAGQRLMLARFNGKVKITEKTSLVPVLGTVQKGTKRIIASFVVCGDPEYYMNVDNGFINSGKVYEAVADVDGERIYFAGLRFEDSEPLKNELVFEITDLELIRKFME